MRLRRGTKRRILIGTLIAVMLIAVFGLALHLIEKHGIKDEQFGDSGEWGNAQDGPIVITLGDKDYVTNDSIDTYLIAGTDAGGQDMGEGFNGELADFIMLLLIDNTTEKYAFYQIDRNSMTDVPVMSDAGDFADFFTQQICTSHWYGNSEEERNGNLANSVAALMGGFPVGRYYVMNMEDIGTVNDAIGGVTVTIPTDMTVADPAFTEGASVHLEGDQAEKFLRARMSLKDDTNAARMSRQEQYVKNAYSMIIDKVKENPEYINDLYQGLEGVFETDGNGKDLSKATNRMIQFENNGFIRFDGTTKLGDTFGDGEEHEETYVDEQSILEELRKVINLEEYVEEDELDEDEEQMFVDPDDVNGAVAGESSEEDGTDSDSDSAEEESEEEEEEAGEDGKSSDSDAEVEEEE